MPRPFHEAERATARRLRQEMTAAEAMLWRALRNRGIGAKFRRQVPIGGYIADFACIPARLIVELDGPPHDGEARRRSDAARDAALRSQGWTVVRYSNEVVLGGGNIVLNAIAKEIAGPRRPRRGDATPSPAAREKVSRGA